MSVPAPSPAYLRIAGRIARDIARGRLRPDDRLPPERTLAADLGVAVGTLRKALARLESEGLLVRRHGSGNYVAGIPAAAETDARIEARSGAALAVALLSDETLPPPPDMPGTGPLRRLRRLHRAAGVAVAAEERWEAPSETAGQVEDIVGAGPFPPWAAAALGAGSACHLRRLESDAAGVLRSRSDIWFDPARVVYRARVR